ncbi:hypothetical protein SAMN02910400_01512 [Lachnospiraceae bacterium C10]|nr:hypothetical protein SAMN02910400_01512 [Lachnospiraceae bacterium C10]
MKKKVAMKAMAAALAVTTALGVVPAKSAYAYYLDSSYSLEGESDKEDTDSWNRELSWVSKTFGKSEKSYVIPKNQKHTYIWGKNYGIDPNKFTWKRGLLSGGGDESYWVDADKAKLDFYSFEQNRRATIVALDDRVDELNKKVKAWNKPIIAYNKKVFAWDKKQSYYKEAKASEKKTWFQDYTQWTNGHPDLAFYKKDQGDFKHGGGYCPLMRYYLPAYKVKNGKLYAGCTEDGEIQVIAPRVEDLTNNIKYYAKSKYARFFTLKNTSDAAINTLAEQLYKLYFGDDAFDEIVIKMNKADTVKVCHKVQDYFFHKNQGLIPSGLVMNPFHAKDENGKNYNVFLTPPGRESAEGVHETAGTYYMSEYLSIAFKSAKENIRKAAEEDPSIISRCKDFEKWQSFADIKEPVNRLIMHNYSRNSTRYTVYKGEPVIALNSYLPELWGMSTTMAGDYVITTYKGKKYIYDPYADKNELIPYTESKWKKLAKEQIDSSDDEDIRTHRGHLVEE